ncbi:700_t:CDS:2, partial [Entrophospora sp. SA101]
RKHDVDTVDKSSIKMDESKKKSNKKKSKKSSNNPSKKSFTISIALPGSIIDNAQTPELKSYLAGQLARTFAIYCVDEVVIFNEGLNLTNSDPNESSNIFLARILQYLETPQYLRKDLFPVHKDLKYAGLLNPLDCPHHVRQEEKSQYREGVVIDTKPKGMEGALVNAGLKKVSIIYILLQFTLTFNVNDVKLIPRDFSSRLLLLMSKIWHFPSALTHTTEFFNESENNEHFKEKL